MKTPLTSRFRRAFRAAFVALLFGAAPVLGQTVSPVLTIDQDRLFSETRLGAATIAELEQRAQVLAAENAQIEAELIAEEQALTEQRATLSPEEFTPLADAFDARVQSFRVAQDEKARALTRAQEEARSAFFRDIAVILSGIVREKGAVVVIDRRDVFLSADSIDITQEAIERVNAASRGGVRQDEPAE